MTLAAAQSEHGEQGAPPALFEQLVQRARVSSLASPREFRPAELPAGWNAAGDQREEAIVFEGASFLRSISRAQVSGLAPRFPAGAKGERRDLELPRFTDLYQVPTASGEASAWVLAQLESVPATGAFAFRITPEDRSLVDVTAYVFLRAPARVLGIALLTSMYLYGEEAPNHLGDMRPEVHESDGLVSVSESGEALFRPLRNPPRPHVTSFRMNSPRALGLVQRDRDFASYEDRAPSYQKRLSTWIEPLDAWGPGALRLLEIPTSRESDDNVAMLWFPDTVPADGLRLRYRIRMGNGIASAGPAAQVVATRLASAGSDRVRFLVDFAGTALRELSGAQPVELNVSARGGRVVEQHTERNIQDGRCRAAFEVVRESPRAHVDLRAFLHAGPDVLTETWSYVWQSP